MKNFYSLFKSPSLQIKDQPSEELFVSFANSDPTLKTKTKTFTLYTDLKLHIRDPVIVNAHEETMNETFAQQCRQLAHSDFRASLKRIFFNNKQRRTENNITCLYTKR